MDDKLTEFVHVRVTPAEKQELQYRAEQIGLSLSRYLVCMGLQKIETAQAVKGAEK